MSKQHGISESTIARMAGNIAAGIAQHLDRGVHLLDHQSAAEFSVSLARAIAAEVERTQPPAEAPTPRTEP